MGKSKYVVTITRQFGRKTKRMVWRLAGGKTGD